MMMMMIDDDDDDDDDDDNDDDDDDDDDNNNKIKIAESICHFPRIMKQEINGEGNIQINFQVFDVMEIDVERKMLYPDC